MENSTIGFFKERARLHLGHAPDEHDLLGWLAVMQHYGAPTRLQDWTQSPFVAAYFAYREQTGDDAALWSLQAYFCRRNLTPLMPEQPWDQLGVFEAGGHDADGNEVRIFPWTEMTPTGVENDALREAIRDGNGWPLPVLPLAYDARMAAQQAVFLCATQIDFGLETLMDKDAWPPAIEPERVKEVQNAAAPPSEAYQLMKRIKLPSEWRTDALRSLRQMGIAEETLFPGLDGSGRAARMHILNGRLGLRDSLQHFPF
jgi:FRG domain